VAQVFRRVVLLARLIGDQGLEPFDGNLIEVCACVSLSRGEAL
jgi:hypothetical protein